MLKEEWETPKINNYSLTALSKLIFSLVQKQKQPLKTKLVQFAPVLLISIHLFYSLRRESAVVFLITLSYIYNIGKLIYLQALYMYNKGTRGRSITGQVLNSAAYNTVVFQYFYVNIMYKPCVVSEKSAKNRLLSCFCFIF